VYREEISLHRTVPSLGARILAETLRQCGKREVTNNPSGTRDNASAAPLLLLDPLLLLLGR
jgi:hypothetical protein